MKTFDVPVTNTANLDTCKQLHEELKVEKEQFQGAFETSAIGMAIVSLNGKWIKVNDSLLKILGYEREQLYQHTFQDITHPDDLDADLQLVKELLEGKKQNYQMEKRYFNSNGLVIWALLSVSIVRDIHGKPLHFVSQIIDITESKKLARLRLSEMDRHNNRIAFELHENIAQTIASIKLYLGSASAEKLYEGKKLTVIDDKLSSLIEEITALSDRIIPTTFILENLYDLIRGLVVKYTMAHNIKPELHIDDSLKELNFYSSYHIFRIVEDQLKLAVLNHASVIRLKITKSKTLLLEYSNDGHEPDAKDIAHLNLLANNIRTRVEIIEGVINNTDHLHLRNKWSITVPWK